MLPINAIYPAFDGEVNKFGIGYPTIFVRTQGCHLRCYKKTKGILCDTPEALSRDDSKDGFTPMSLSDTITAILEVIKKTGIRKVTFSGGDPLFNKESDLIDFFHLLDVHGIPCTVETSGTLSIEPYKDFKNVYWVLDYKLQSAGVPQQQVAKTLDNMRHVKDGDFLKFVIDDEADYNEMMMVIKDPYVERGIHRGLRCAAGLFWGSKSFTNLQLFQRIIADGVGGVLSMNFQTHKLIIQPDFSAHIPKMI